MMTGTHITSPQNLRLVVSLTVFALLSVLLLLFRTQTTDPDRILLPSTKTNLPVASYVKPSNLTVVGLVFYGRKDRVEILRCYVERNLVENGGWLDEIQWYQNTDNEENLAYLDEIIASNPRYKKILNLNTSMQHAGQNSFEGIWHRIDPGKLYIKIDDDIVFLGDDTIASMVNLKVAHPEYLVVSANVVNSPWLSDLHYRMGATHPYLPDVNESSTPQSFQGSAWRYTDHPTWQGPDDWTLAASAEPPPSKRWLRLMGPQIAAMNRTPMSSVNGNPNTSYFSPGVAVQHHYSLLENLAEQRLDRYDRGKEWSTNYARTSINLIAVWANEVLENLPMDGEDDEAWLTITLPKRLGKSVVLAANAAVAAHFAYFTQVKYIESTDLLERYKSYADENVCRK